MKYRIIQKGNKFYPQTKTFLFWETIVQETEEGYLNVVCFNYEEALTILKDIKSHKDRKPEARTVHEVYL